MSEEESNLSRMLKRGNQHKEQNEEKLKTRRIEVSNFLSNTVGPAFEEIKIDFEKKQRIVNILKDDEFYEITVKNEDQIAIQFSVKFEILPDQAIPYYIYSSPINGISNPIKNIIPAIERGWDYHLLKKEEIILDFNNTYKDLGKSITFENPWE